MLPITHRSLAKQLFRIFSFRLRKMFSRFCIHSAVYESSLRGFASCNNLDETSVEEMFLFKTVCVTEIKKILLLHCISTFQGRLQLHDSEKVEIDFLSVPYNRPVCRQFVAKVKSVSENCHNS